LPRGKLVYRQQNKVLFICAGSGITSAFSMANALLSQPHYIDKEMSAFTFWFYTARKL
jgi:ferredoxin-NADP reductase